jgi:aminopeptidase N
MIISTSHRKFRISFVILLFCTCLNQLQAQKPGASIDIQHYEFGIQLNDDSNVVKGNAVIEFLLLKDTQTILLDLVSKRADGKGMTITAVMENNQPLVFEHADNIVSVHLAALAHAGEKRTIVIQYGGIPADGLIIANNKYRHRGFFADHWPNRAKNWLPCIDHPSDKASVDFIITAPAHYDVVSNGVQVQQDSLSGNLKRTHYKEETPLPMKIMVIGVADFAIQHAGDVQNIPVYSWVYPEDKEKGFYDYAQAIDILPFFIQNVGAYAYKKLANVQSKTIFGGMENAGTIFYSENSITGTRKTESLLAHEIAHQWFGDMATERDWPHLWLSEGFATYMTILYFEKTHGADTAKKMLQQDREQVIAFSHTQKRAVVDTTVTNYMELLNANSYQKGGWVLHMLRQQTGDSIFWKGVRQYYAQYKGRNASTRDLQKVMETVSGKDLSVFFQQWLYTPGQPLLDISWKYGKSKKSISVTIVQQQATLFKFPLELSVRGKNGTVSKVIDISQKETNFSIPVKDPVQSVLVDPNTRLLYEGSVKQVQ